MTAVAHGLQGGIVGMCASGQTLGRSAFPRRRLQGTGFKRGFDAGVRDSAGKIRGEVGLAHGS
jgi:hypothetical protein